VRSATSVGRGAEWTHLLVDRDQNVWGGLFGAGLFRIRAPDAPTDAAADSAPIEILPSQSRLTGDVSWSVFEDREGDIWVGTNGGLDRFRQANVLRQSLIGTDSPRGYGLWTTRRGAVLVGDAQGLFKAEPGQALKPWFPDMVVSALCEGPDQVLWAFTQGPSEDGGRLFRIKGDGRTVISPPGATTDVVSCSVDESGGLWVVAREQPAYRWSGGRVRRYAAPDNPDFSSVQAFGQDEAFLVRNRNLFKAGATGLAPVDYGATRFFPGSLVQLWRGQGGALVAASNGVVKLDGARSWFLSDARFAWLEDINGLARRDQNTWLRSKDGVTLVASSALDRAFVDPGYKPVVRTFGLADGLVGASGVATAAPVVIGGDGRAWLATTSGVFSIDPARLYRNAVPPPVVISALTVDGRRQENPTNVTLPRGARSLQIDYAALSLSLPERVGFRYRLEGVDADWVDPGRRRQAFYTNLPPGRYVFRVKAANEDGVWNETGARLDLHLPPTFAQSRVFLALCGLAALGLGWMAYRLRLQQVAGRIRARLRERLAERERIARELHDTLLQGVQGLVLTFHAATRQVPAQSPARGRLESALARAEAVIVEARDRVRHLRGATGENLAMALAALVERVDPDQTFRIRLEANGPNRRLHPVVADEVEQLVAEALTNACRHAEAGAILLRVTFEARGLSVQIEDDGKGIDPGIVEAGEREGHFGLAGMRERAGKIGGVLSIRNGDSAGAVVELFVPARAAFAEQTRRWRLFGPSSIDGWLER
jgi:signal transduction histidine kinase